MNKIKTDLSIGEVSKRSGVAISSIHFYENKGLICSHRNSSNHRRFSRDVLRKISVIKIAQKSGVQLKEIKEALATIPDNKTVTLDDWSRLSKQWHNQLDERINQLIALRDNLDSCIGCGCLSIDRCRLANPYDTLGDLGPGPHLKPNGVEYEDPSSKDDTCLNKSS